MEYFLDFIGVFIIVFSHIYIWKKLLNVSINKRIRFIFITLLTSIVVYALQIFVVSYIKVIIVFLVLIVSCCKIYNKNIKSCISAVFTTQLVFVLSEIIFAIISSIILKSSLTFIANTFYNKLTVNLFVSILSLLIYKIKKINNLYLKINELIFKMNFYKSIMIFLFLLIIIIAFIYFSYYDINKIIILLVNLLVLIIYIFLTFKIIEEHSNHVIIKSEYDNLLDKAVDYETIIDSQRMENHENKNDLYILRNMIPKTNKEAHAQLDDMINDYEKQTKKYKDDKDLYYETLKVPSGGLRGLIYQKSLYMKNNNIDYSIRIDRKVNSKTLNNVSRETLRNLGKIVGVYLDNAIQEVEKLNTKQIGIEIYMTGKDFNISIANNIGSRLELDSINKTGYSTKGGKHGYGLSLVNELLNSDKNITCETNITSNIFRQNIKIKM